MNAIRFGEVRYGVLQTRGLTIANTGQISATFSFIDRPVTEGQQCGIAPSWLDLRVEMASDNINYNATTSKEYTLSPGETTNIVLTIEIMEFELVQKLNTGSALIDDVLVLRINNGRDHFIPVRGTWMQSSFCRTLDELASLPEGGVRSLQNRESQQVSSMESGGKDDATGNRNPNARHSASRELFMLTEAIQDHAERSIADWDMTHDHDTPPWASSSTGVSWPFAPETWTLERGPERSRLLAAAREALDTTTPFNTFFESDVPCIIRLEVLCETLLMFLDSLLDGVVTTRLWSEMEAQMVAREKAKTVLDTEEARAWAMEIMSTAPVHSVAFTFLIFMLVKILNESAPLPSDQSATSKSSRISISSTRSEASEASSSLSGPDLVSSKASFFPSFRRRARTNTGSSASRSVASSAAIDKRKAVQEAFTKIFARCMIRSEKEDELKERERKVLESRKRKILDPFLNSSTV